MPYSIKLISRCKTVLSKSDVFAQPDHLVTFFNGDLDAYRDGLPDAQSHKSRAEKCVDYLLHLPLLEDGKPAIMVFVLNLLSHYADQDSYKQQLEELINDFSKEPENSIQGISQDKQAAGRNEIADLQWAARQVQRDPTESSNIRDWFQDPTNDLNEKVFRIALAVLNGGRYGSVLSASDSLFTLLNKRRKEATEQSTPDPFARDDTKRLEYMEIKYIKSASNESQKIAQYKDQAYPYSILELVWKEFASPQIREPLITWLTELVKEGQYDVRNRVALAVGLLAQMDFPDVWEMILSKWAQKDERLYRAMIGKALGIAIENNSLSGDIITALNLWGNSKSEKLVWAANRAYSNVGVYFPQKAFEQWRKTMQSTTRIVEYKITPSLHLSTINPLHMSIIDSMLWLLLSVPGTENYSQVYQVALEQLVSWSKSEPSRSRPNLGLSLFIVCTNTFIRETEGDNTTTKENSSEIPAMVKLIKPNIYDTYRQTLSELLYLSLENEPTRAAATDSIHNWIYWTNNTRYEDELTTIIRDLFTYSKRHKVGVAERLRLYLKEWGRNLSLASKIIDSTDNKLLPL